MDRDTLATAIVTGFFVLVFALMLWGWGLR
jgi:hypothetical protein